MQQDADKIDEMRTHRLVDSKVSDNDNIDDSNTGNAKFLKDMRSNVLAGDYYYY